jgi:hypothetical protein
MFYGTIHGFSVSLLLSLTPFSLRGRQGTFLDIDPEHRRMVEGEANSPLYSVT